MIFKYIGALWKKSLIKQMLSFTYSIPIMFLIFTNLMQMVLPSYSVYKFFDRSNFVYLYDNMPMYISETEKSYDYIKENEGTLLLYKETTLYSKYNEQITSDVSFYEKQIFERIYFATVDNDIENTYFSKNNFITNNISKEMNTIYITYGTAKVLDVKKGDTVSIKINQKAIDFKLAGYLKPLYKSLTIDYSVNEGFTSLAYLSDEEYENLKLDGERINFCFFTNTEQDNRIREYLVTKEELKESVRMFISQKETKRQIILATAFIIFVLFILTYFEFSFTRRKNRKDIETLSKLGMPVKTIRTIYFTSIYISYIVAVVIALLIGKFIYLDRILAIYFDMHLLLTFIIPVTLVGSLFIIIQSFLIRKYK